jgi:thiosulfate dehydrogenase [quinone] large subunit
MMAGTAPSRPVEQRVAYVLLRVAVGVDFLGHGLIRLLHGDEAFAAGMVKQMAETPLPPGLVHVFGLVVPVVELTIGVLLVLGLWTRWALMLGGVLMIALMTGITLKQDWPTAGLQLIYSLVLSLLLFLRADCDAGWVELFRRR